MHAKERMTFQVLRSSYFDLDRCFSASVSVAEDRQLLAVFVTTM